MAKGARLLPQMGDINHKVNKAFSLPMGVCVFWAAAGGSEQILVYRI